MNTKWRPGRKIFGGALCGIATAAVMQWTNDLAMTYDAFRFLTEDSAKAGLPIIVAFGIGYLIPEKKQPQETKDEKAS